jgi:peptide/nickel transport system substrate-binding protein
MLGKIFRNIAIAGLLASSVLATPAGAFERTEQGNVIVFGGRQAIPVLDPHIRYDWSTRMMQQAVYDGLVKYEGNPAEIKPWLAETWETSEDGKTWTFHLVKNAKFHNGDPVTAEAVRYSFERGLKLNKGVAWML